MVDEQLDHVQKQLDRIERVTASRQRFAVLFAVLAVCFSLAEFAARSAQATAQSYAIEASGLWAFFQARIVRQTIVRTTAQVLEIEIEESSDPRVRDAKRKLMDNLNQIAARFR